MKATRKFKEWFYGRVEIPSSAWYVLAGIGAVVYVASIIISSIINNQ